MKFKVGDKVRVVRVLYDVAPNQAPPYVGRIFKITKIHRNDGVLYEVSGCNWLWHEEELEYANDEFTKADLKDGMVVEYRGGGRRMVLNRKLVGETCYMLLEHFSRNLEHFCFNNYTIDKIYKSSAYTLPDYFNDENLELIWERNPVKKMTIAEIEKELGYNIEIVDDKEETNNDSK